MVAELIPLIRFPLMEMDELLVEVQPSGMLDQETLVDVITCHAA